MLPSPHHLVAVVGTEVHAKAEPERGIVLLIAPTLFEEEGRC